MLISIIIANFNYAEFVGTAIESALALQWDNTEVIVVDDGSTDHSINIIEIFGPRITFLRQEHAGQRIAYKKPGRNVFLEVKVQRHAIVLHMVDVPDPDHILSEIPETHGWHQLAKRTKVQTETELERVLPLIKAAWLRG